MIQLFLPCVEVLVERASEVVAPSINLPAIVDEQMPDVQLGALYNKQQ
jgi:hypothetical protein